MNDETRRMQEKLFDQIVLGLALIGLISALSLLVINGYSSPWFFRAVALIIVALVAFGLRRVTQFVIAAYVLIIELFGITTAVFLQTNAFGFIPFLFLPVIVIAGLLLSPAATIGVGIISMLIILAVAISSQQFSLATFITLLPPFSLIILTTFLVIQGRRYVEKLSERLVESRTLLKERTLEMMDAQKTIGELQEKSNILRSQLLNTQDEVKQMEQVAQEKTEGLYELIKGTLQELDISIESLEQLIDQISENPSPEEQAKSLEKIWQKIYHLNSLVVNLEDLAQLKNNRVSLTYREVDVAQLIRDVVGTTRGLARGKNLEIRSQIPEDLPKLMLDPARIRQALLYVLNNAIKYTDQGIIEVQAEMNSKELLIFVSDTGIGMQREEIASVFSEFSRGSGTLAQQRQGTGLGLAISKAMVELHGGHMWVTSVLGVGSTFYFNLPLQKPVKIPSSVPMAISQAATKTTVDAPPAPTIPALDEEKPIKKPVPALNGKTPIATTKPGFGSPVGRFSPTYIGRLAFISLALLLIVASGVAILAAYYGPTSQEEETAAAAAVSSPTQIAAIVDTPNTATPESVVIVMPTDTPSPTDTPEPTDTPTPIPTQTPTTSPTDTPVPTKTFTPTKQPTATPKPTNTPLPTSTPTTQPTVVSNADVQPVSIRRPAGLSFATGQSIGLQSLTNGSDNSLDTLGSAVADSSISWSPQGDRVLFTTTRDGDYEIYVANADGSKIVNLTDSEGYDTQPSWSPDGRRVAFSSGRNGNIDIYVMNADGSNPQRLTTSRGFEEWPVWSPDGRKIAFVTDRDGNNEIYVMNADGSNQQRLTDHPADDWPAAWSPDGRQLVFSSNRDGNWNLYVIDADGGEALQLTDAPGDERDPIWSSDGRTIAFVSNQGGNWDVFTLSVPTGTATVVANSQWTQITDTPNVDERYPTWTP